MDLTTTEDSSCQNSTSSFGYDDSNSENSVPMNKVEKEIHREADKKKKDFNLKILNNRNESETKEQCFIRLQGLLSRSQFYAQFLVARIEAQKEAARIAQEKLIAKEKKFGSTLKDTTSILNTSQRPQRSSKRPARFNDEGLPKGKRPKRVDDIEELLDVNETLTGSQEDSQDDDEELKLEDARQETAQGTDSRQPPLFTGGVMREYQLAGFEWMKVLYENAINGILADEMGLGKTIQCIALIAHLVGKGVKGQYFICAPLSTISNWVREFQRFTPKISVLLYHGDKEVRTNLRKKFMGSSRHHKSTIHVIITSYEIAIIDRCYLEKIAWRYIIVDEGHRIKNSQCLLVQELKKYTSNNRLLLTGTPLQNNLSELWSLLNFLLPELFDDLQVFQSWFDITSLQETKGDAELIEQEREKQIVGKMHQILAPFLLRRTKGEVDIDLPPKKEVLVYAPLMPLQEKFYRATLNRTIQQLLCPKDEGEFLTENEAQRPKRRCSKNIDYSVFGDSGSTGDSPTKLDEDNKVEEVDSEAEADEIEAGLAERLQLKSAVKPAALRNLTSDVRLTFKNIYSQLRKLCQHPYLVEYPLTDSGEYKVDEKLILHSGKLRVLDSLLKALKERGHKVLIFSQMVMLLDILHDYCFYRGFDFCKLDGRMGYEDREAEIDRFNQSPDSFIFLVSTRAGGLGINLTAADTVIIFDSDWNPQSDLQAQDRCHRFGQTKPVVIYRLVTANTVDEKVVFRASAKRKLEKIIIKKGRFNGRISNQQEALELEDMRSLLDSVNQRKFVVPEKGDVYTPQQLDMLLDRSDLLNQDNLAECEGLFEIVKQPSA